MESPPSLKDLGGWTVVPLALITAIVDCTIADGSSIALDNGIGRVGSDTSSEVIVIQGLTTTRQRTITGGARLVRWSKCRDHSGLERGENRLENSSLVAGGMGLMGRMGPI